MKYTDPYQSFKKGIRDDVISTAINLTGAFGVFFLILFLLMCFWALVMEKSGLEPATRIGLLIFLIIVVPCLFFKRTGNFIVKLWGLILLLVIGGLAIFIFGWFTFVCFKVAFEL